ncbi:MAG TPA: hypothetical protein OIM34_07870 [Ruminococcus bromii]|nr:hypothetical protein [Ruminococcus bromii]
MRTTKKIVSAVLAACMLASTAVVSSFAATADDSFGSFKRLRKRQFLHKGC